MALTGTLLADFSSFNTAVQGAEVKLRDFDSGAGKVSASLSRMTDTFSGRKIIQDATLMAQVFQDLGGATAFTTTELARMSAVGAEAADKLRAMGKDVPPGIQAMADAATKAEASLKGVGVATTETGSFIETFAGQVTGMAAGFVSAQAVMGLVTSAFRTLTQFVGDSVQSFAAAETGQVRMTAALRQHSLATPEVVEQYNALATAFQRTTANADEEINTMEALLTQIGGVMPSAMAGALKASTDLAAGLGIDLESATRLVAKAAAGHIETLGKYGITVSAAAYESKGFEAVLEAVNRQFGGQAAAELTTYSGQIKQLAADWDNVKEAIGKFVITNPLAVAAMREFRQATQDAGDNAATMGVSVARVMATLGADPALVAVVAHFEDLASEANGVADAMTRLNAAPNWFKTLAGGGGALPAITEGMKLFNAEVKYDEEVAKAAAEAAKKFDAAWAELSVTGATAKDTIAAINPETLKTIDYYLRAGVSVQTLAAAFPEAGEAGVAAAKKIQDATDAMVTDTASKWDQYSANIVAATGNAYLIGAQKIDEWYRKDVEAREKAGTADAAYFAQMQLLNDQAYATLIAQTDRAVVHQQAAAADYSKRWGIGFYEVEADCVTWRTAMDEASAAIDGDLQRNIKNVQTLSGAFITAAEAKKQFDAGGSAEVTSQNFRSIVNSYNTGNGTLPGGGFFNVTGAENLAQLGYSFAEIIRILTSGGTGPIPPPQGPRIPGFASGVENFSGGMAMVGEKGPELVNLPKGSDVIPYGQGGGKSSPVINLTFHIVDTESGIARRVSDQILRTLKSNTTLASGLG